jgi:glycosyltransferase involved in cell wall biosynthesis
MTVNTHRSRTEDRGHRLKLGLVAAEFLPNWGGAGTYNVRLVKHLMDEVEIHVITPRRTINGSTVAYSAEDILDFFDHKINLHFICHAGDTFLYNARFQWAVLRELPGLQRRYQFDVIHTDHPHMSDILYKSKSGIPSVNTVHTTIKGHLKGIRQSRIRFLQMEPSERYQILLNIPLLLVERFYLKRRQQIITVSQWMKNELSWNYRKKDIEVVYSGVEPDEFSPEKGRGLNILPEIDVPIVLFSSRMTAAKGGHFMIKAIPRILQENQRVHFVFAGSELEQPWKSLLAEQRIPPEYYTFLGYLPYEQLPALYARASIYVCPSLCENLPARILEAMSCELPVVATNIYGIPEAITHGDNGLLVPPQDDEALAGAILTLLDDEPLRRRLGIRARRTVLEKYDWRKLAPQIKGVYEKVVERSR